MNNILYLFAAILTTSAFSCSALNAEEMSSKCTDSKGGFSYSIPDGWIVRSYPNQSYKVSGGPPTNGFSPNITAHDEIFTCSLEDYVAQAISSIKANPKKKFLDITAFKTNTATEALKISTMAEAPTLALKETFYLFFTEKSGEKRALFFLCSSSAETSDKNDVIFESIMKSVILYQ